MVSGSADNTVRIWEWQPNDLIDTACHNVGRNLSRAEWKQYIGDALPYPTNQKDAPCPNRRIEPEATPTP